MTFRPAFSAAFSLLWVALLPAQTFDGYTLYSKIGNTKTYLINMNNTVYHQWTVSPGTGYSCYLLPGGTLLRTCNNWGNQLNGGGMTGMVQKVDWNGNVLWQYTHSSATYCLHHDIKVMPNGNILMISYDVKTAAQAAAAGCNSNITIWSEKIMEVEPVGTNGGNIVWEWKLWDHLVQNADPSKPNYGQPVDHPERFNVNYQVQKDWFHMNGIDYNEALDQIVLSSHNWSEIYVIDHSTTTAEAAGSTGGNSGRGGDILYRWGNPQTYGAGTAANKVLKVVHDAHWVPEDCPKANYLAGFNNQGGSGNTSCIDLVLPPYDGYTYTHTPGAAYTPATYNWRHQCQGNSSGQSSSQQLPNGNMLICLAQSGKMYEIDSNQSVLWSYTVGGSVAKAYRYSPGYVAGTLSAIASGTPATICPGYQVQLNVTYSSVTTPSFSWSSDPPGWTSAQQNPAVSPVVTTVYTVTVATASDTVSSSVTITVDPLPPTPVITQNGSLLTSSATSGNQWYFNGNAINGATAQSHSPTQDGPYQVQVNNGNGCVSAMSAVFYYYAAFIPEEVVSSGLDVFPNPARGILHVEWPGTDPVSILVLNNLGMKICSLDRPGPVDISSWPAGCYVVRVINELTGTAQTKKINIIK